MSFRRKKISQKNEVSIRNKVETYRINRFRKALQVIPFYLNGEKYYKIDPSHRISFSTITISKEFPIPEDIGKRIEKLFSNNFEELCHINEVEVEDDTYLFIKPKPTCHHFVNYLAFGMEVQDDINFDIEIWYKKLPFVEIYHYQVESLRCGDIVQFMLNDKLVHSVLYIGNDLYINKHGRSSIYFQKIEGIKEKYESNSAHILRVKADCLLMDLTFRRNYELY
ncbi:hypothetical protein [Endozoicomonas ascidiicola]|uniref:hypothetical protein n=1 Tax=Endozoicomonas ascidiicola TaxID=1698521 RepID=UPI000834F552|nr:hypothetical protein [Endozoicomonas ascidiicola]